MRWIVAGLALVLAMPGAASAEESYGSNNGETGFVVVSDVPGLNATCAYDTVTERQMGNVDFVLTGVATSARNGSQEPASTSIRCRLFHWFGEVRVDQTFPGSVATGIAVRSMAYYPATICVSATVHYSDDTWRQTMEWCQPPA